MSERKVTFSGNVINANETNIVSKSCDVGNDNVTVEVKIEPNFNSTVDQNKELQFTFALPNLTFNQFESHLDKWFTILQDEVNIFWRQVDETEYRGNLIKNNEKLIGDVTIFLEKLKENQKLLETNIELINFYMCSIENIINVTDKPGEFFYSDEDERIRSYSLLIDVNYQINSLENALAEVTSYLNDSVERFLNSPCGIIREIIRLNDITLKRITCDLNNLEYLSRSLNTNLDEFEHHL